jgi:hypothetical protein
MMGRATDVERRGMLAVNEVTWQQAGHVNEPGRYMFRFGWLTVTADDRHLDSISRCLLMRSSKRLRVRQPTRRRSFILAPSNYDNTPRRAWTVRRLR